MQTPDLTDIRMTIDRPLVGRLARLKPFTDQSCATSDWALCNGTRGSEYMTALATALTTSCTSAAPFKGRGFTVPSTCGRFEGIDNLLCRLWVLTVERPADQDALNGLGHVEPGTTQWRVERHDPVVNKPAYHVRAAVPHEIVPDQ